MQFWDEKWIPLTARVALNQVLKVTPISTGASTVSQSCRTRVFCPQVEKKGTAETIFYY